MRLGVLGALRIPHLAKLWASQVFSAMGDHLYTIAVAWLAAEAVGNRAGLVVGAGAASALAFGLLGGVYADRWDRRKTMVAVDLLRAAAVTTVPVAAHLGDLSMWHLGAVAAVIAGLDAFFDPALVASLPALVGDDPGTLRAANALMDGTRRLARVFAPSLAGLLVAALPIAHFFTLDALSFGISAAAILSLGGRFRWKPSQPEGAAVAGTRGVLAEIVGALRVVGASRVLVWAFVGAGLVGAAFGAVITVGAALLASRAFGGSVGAYGLIVGAYGLGNVLANLVVGSATVRRPAVTLFLGMVLLGAGFLVLSGAPAAWIAMAGAAVAAVGGSMRTLVLLTMIQGDLPRDQVGKAYGLHETVHNACNALGLVLTGPLFALLGLRTGMASLALPVLAIGAAGLIRFGRGGRCRAGRGGQPGAG